MTNDNILWLDYLNSDSNPYEEFGVDKLFGTSFHGMEPTVVRNLLEMPDADFPFYVAERNASDIAYLKTMDEQSETAYDGLD